jgi:hypothetical protein
VTADDAIVQYLETGVLDDAAWAALTEPDRQRVEAELPELDRLRTELADAGTWDEPIPTLEGLILASLMAEPAPVVAPTTPPVAPVAPVAPPVAVLRGLGPVPPTDPAGDAGSGSVVTLADARTRRSRVVAVGAVIVAAAAVVVAVIGFSSRPPRPPDESATLAAPVALTTSSVLADDGSEFVLTSTDLQPGASGRVRLRETGSGVQVRLDAAGLPRRDNGQFYQAWVKTERGLVPIGTFHSGDAVVLWSGVDIDELTAVTITLEDNDGNQESSGRRVLVATISPRGTGTTSGTGSGTSTAPGTSTAGRTEAPAGTTPGSASPGGSPATGPATGPATSR